MVAPASVPSADSAPKLPSVGFVCLIGGRRDFSLFCAIFGTWTPKWPSFYCLRQFLTQLLFSSALTSFSFCSPKGPGREWVSCDNLPSSHLSVFLCYPEINNKILLSPSPTPNQKSPFTSTHTFTSGDPLAQQGHKKQTSEFPTG